MDTWHIESKVHILGHVNGAQKLVFSAYDDETNDRICDLFQLVPGVGLQAIPFAANQLAEQGFDTDLWGSIWDKGMVRFAPLTRPV